MAVQCLVRMEGAMGGGRRAWRGPGGEWGLELVAWLGVNGFWRGVGEGGWLMGLGEVCCCETIRSTLIER